MVDVTLTHIGRQCDKGSPVVKRSAVSHIIWRHGKKIAAADFYVTRSVNLELPLNADIWN